MANSGRAEDALQYYYKALELNPGYIRARHASLVILLISTLKLSFQVQSRYFMHQPQGMFSKPQIDRVLK